MSKNRFYPRPPLQPYCSRHFLADSVSFFNRFFKKRCQIDQEHILHQIRLSPKVFETSPFFSPSIAYHYLYFRIRHSFAHLRPVILSADWSICRLQSWTCSNLPTFVEFLKLTQSTEIEIQRQSADLFKVQLCNWLLFFFFVVSQEFMW